MLLHLPFSSLPLRFLTIMHDMLVRLYALPELAPLVRCVAEQGINIRRCRPFELHLLQHWVAANFSPKWVSEATIAMSRQPPGCFIATHDGQILGFVCVDVTMRGFIGPMGLAPTSRGKGIGRVLLLRGLHEMRALGYAYAVIGGVGPAEFYRHVIGAIDIPDSTPGIYGDLLPDTPQT